MFAKTSVLDAASMEGQCIATAMEVQLTMLYRVGEILPTTDNYYMRVVDVIFQLTLAVVPSTSRRRMPTATVSPTSPVSFSPLAAPRAIKPATAPEYAWTSRMSKTHRWLCASLPMPSTGHSVRARAALTRSSPAAIGGS